MFGLAGIHARVGAARQEPRPPRVGAARQEPRRSRGWSGSRVFLRSRSLFPISAVLASLRMMAGNGLFYHSVRVPIYRHSCQAHYPGGIEATVCRW